MKIKKIRKIVDDYRTIGGLAREYAKLNPKYKDDFPNSVHYDYLNEEFHVDFIRAREWESIPINYLTMSPDEVKEEFKSKERGS